MHSISAESQLVILAPAQSAASRGLRNVKSDSRWYGDLLADMQRLRGESYLRDGAIRADELTSDGRHILAIDERSWHVLALDAKRKVCGCVRYLAEKPEVAYKDLWIGEAAIARCPQWGRHFRRSVEQERAQAQSKGVDFAEVGGWAVAEDRRWTPDPLRMILGVWGLSKLLGGCVGVATATVRHGSAMILRRIGLMPMTVDGVEIPAYYDPQYGCEMQGLRFDSDFPNPKYRNWIEELRHQLELTSIVCNVTKTLEWMAPAVRRDSPILPVGFPLSIAGELAR
jgi:hypothetical protein